MDKHIYAVIMAGGSGDRFWPMSTSERPKQFVSLFGGKPLIRHATDRLSGLVPPERTIVVTARSLEETTATACPNLPRGNIIGEPCRRDTAAAAALACGIVAARDPKGVAMLLTADQLVEDEPRFRQILADSAAIAAQGGAIVTIGIEPTFPATGYGYIETAGRVESNLETVFYKSGRFVEKPDAATAADYLARGGFYWNSGMFIWSVATMSAAVREYAPGLLALLSLPSEAGSPAELAARLDEIYPTLPRISVDYAIMERYPHVIMASGAFGWDDVGSWPAVAKHFPSDEARNTKIGPVTTLDARGNVIVADSGKVIAALGVNDLIIVQTKDATLVCRKDRAQDLKRLVATLAK